MIALNCLKVTCNREGALFQRNWPVCQDKKEPYTEQGKGTAAAEHCWGRGCETNHQRERGWRMPHISLFIGQEELYSLSHRMKSRLAPNGHLGQEGHLQDWEKLEDDISFSTVPNRWLCYSYCSCIIKAEACLESFWLPQFPHSESTPEVPFSTTCGADVQQFLGENVNRPKSPWFLEVK